MLHTLVIGPIREEITFEEYGNLTISNMDVSENSGFSPQIIHGLIGFSMIFTIHFGVPLIFGNTHMKMCMKTMI